MAVILEHKQGLIAGDGLLPVKMAQHARENGFDVVCISLSNDNYKQLKKYCSKVYSLCPGEALKIEKILKDEEIKQLTFLGKVNKTVILKRKKCNIMRTSRWIQRTTMPHITRQSIRKGGLSFYVRLTKKVKP